MMLSTQSGGAETFFEKLCFGFAEAGVPQCVVIEPDSEREALLSSFPGVEVVPIHFGGLSELAGRIKLRRVFREYRPDIGLSWMNRASRRVPSGFCPVVGRLGGYYKIKHYRRCAHLIGITPDLVEHIKSSGWSPDSVNLIPNFGETSEFSIGSSNQRASIRTELGISSDETVLLALGRLHEVKGHDVLIRAMAELESGVLLIAGSGPLLSELRSLADSLGLGQRVKFLGWRRDVSALFAACDISVFPSRYEPNGTVVMESWAHRRPLVASRAKGPEWLVDDGENGLLFQIDSVSELAACLNRLIQEPALAKSLIDAGEEKFLRNFTRKQIVEDYLSLFRRVIEVHR